MANGPLPEIIEYVMCPFSPVSRSWAARHSKFDILPTFSVTKTYNKKKKISLLYMNIQTAISLRSTSLNLRKKKIHQIEIHIELRHVGGTMLLVLITISFTHCGFATFLLPHLVFLLMLNFTGKITFQTSKTIIPPIEFSRIPSDLKL